MTSEQKWSIKVNVTMYLMTHAFIAIMLGVIYYCSGAYLNPTAINELKEAIIAVFVIEFAVAGLMYGINKLAEMK